MPPLEKPSLVKSRISLLLGGIVLLIFVSAGSYVLGTKRVRNKSAINISAITTTPLPSVAQSPMLSSIPTANQTGSIEGSLIYPSEVLPDQIVCAVDIDTSKEYCTDENINDKNRFQSGKGYTLSLPVGKYYVYA